MGRLHQLAQEGNEAQLAHALSQGADPNEPDSDGNAPLHWASDRGSLQAGRLLKNVVPLLVTTQSQSV